MVLKYSKNGIPFIEFDDETRLIFASTDTDKRYYKWLVVKAYDTINGSVKKGKNRKEFTSKTAVNFITDFKLREFPRGFSKRHPTFTDVKKGFLKKVFSKLCKESEEDYPIFPKERLLDLEAKIIQVFGDEYEKM